MKQLLEKIAPLQARFTHCIRRLPVLVLMPHSACNCRCLMCDIWKANAAKQELSEETFQSLLPALAALGVRQVVFSGGEALMHSNLWALCRILKRRNIRITLLSTGLLLARHAADVVTWCDEVIVSLDGSPRVHNAIRNLPAAFEKLRDGLSALHALAPQFRVTGRCVLQRRNYFDLPNIILTARELGLEQISFLAADVHSTAFNRPKPWEDARVREIALDRREVEHFKAVLEEVFIAQAGAFAARFIAESPAKMRRIWRYFAALHGQTTYPAPRCNAPWVSAVIEADGTVRPCFFHPPLGNVNQASLDDILNSPAARRFRKQLDVSRNPLCRQCTCSLYLQPIKLAR